MKPNYLKYSEKILLILIWLIIILAPVFLFQENDEVNWNQVLKDWETIFPYFILFLINHYLLIPYLLFKKKQLQYILSAVGFLFVLSLFLYLTDNNSQQQRPDRHPLPPQHRMMEGPPPGGPRPHDRQLPNKKPFIPAFNTFLIGLLIIGFDAGFRMNFRWNKLEQERTKLEKENIENQLAFLRNQVSPHFFMNTLNNIHSLIDIDTEEAKEAIIKLSKLMRHLLYDCESDKIPLKNELDFISSYINLMKLRFSDKVSIDLNISNNIPPKNIPPLLFTSFVENAFKHGVSYRNASFIKISFIFTDDRLVFTIKNSISDKKNLENGGIGVENSRKRLDILYGKEYQLDIEETPSEYQLRLNIPL